MAVTAKKVQKQLAKKRLTEDVAFQQPTQPLRIDREKGIVYNPKILGWTSKNANRSYKPDGVQVGMYEGIVSYVNHRKEDDTNPRPFEDAFGVFKGVEKREDGLYAKEYHYNTAHALAEQFAWWVEKDPAKVGFSQDAIGDVLEGTNSEVVQRVTKVHSVDFVTNPATTKGVFEATEDEDEDEDDETKKKKKIMEDDLEEEDEDEDDEEEGGDDLELEPDEDEEVGGDDSATGEDENDTQTLADKGGPDISGELLAAAGKIFAATGMSVQDKLKKIAKLLKLHHSDLEESVKPKNLNHAKQLLRVRAKKNRAVKLVLEALDTHEATAAVAGKKAKAEELIKTLKLPRAAVTEHFMEQLIEAKDDRAMKNLIEDRRLVVGSVRSRKPRSSAAGSTLIEDHNDYGDEPTEGKKLTEEEQKKAYEAFEKDVTEGVEDDYDDGEFGGV